ncbi:MAG: hypothetical protein JXA83_11955 [Acidimicrobiales bacterium]|nr:hypothetical protein [Acidimicrobiales bacterium]
MADDGEARRHTRVWRRALEAIDDVVAARAADVDASYARLDGHAAPSAEEARADLDARREDDRAARRAAWRRVSRRCRFLRRLRLRVVVAATVCAVLDP